MNIWQFISDIVLVTFFGLFIAFSPMLIVVNLLIVLKSKKPILHAIALILGILAPLILVAWFGFHFIKPDSEINFNAISEKIKIPPLIYLGFGTSLFVLAYKQMTKPADAFAKAADFHIPNDKFGTLFMFGFMKSLLSATNLFAILVIVKIILDSALNPLVDIIILLWALVVGLVPFGVVLYYHHFRKDYLLQLNKRLNEVMARNVRRIIIVGLYGFASVFTFMGLYELLKK